MSMDIYDSRYFIINKMLMTNLGLWPYQSWLKKFVSRTSLLIFMLSSTLPQIYGLKKNFGVHIDKVIEHVAYLIYISTIILKMLTTTLFEKKLKLVFESIADNWEALTDVQERNILIEYSERGRMLTVGYIIYMIVALIFFISIPLMPLLLNIVWPVEVARQRDFVLHGEFPMNPNDYYKQIYMFDSLSCIATVLVFCAIDSIYAASIEHCLGLFAIVNFTDNLESTYSTSFLMLMGANMMYCVSVTVVLLVHLADTMAAIRYATILVGLIIHLFYISWPGQKLIDHSLGLFDDAYMNEWYCCSIRAQNLLRFMRLRCLTPCQMSAGGIYVMNFVNFASIIKSSLSYITVFASFT